MTEQEIKDSNSLCAIKFGGTSVGDAEAIDRMTGIVSDYRQEGWHVVVVLSAMNGTTNRLVKICQGVEENNQPLVNRELAVLQEAHFTAITKLAVPNHFRESARADLHSLFLELKAETQEWGISSKEKVDRKLSYGERLMVRMAKWKFMGMGIPAEAIDATSIIKTDSNFGEARPDFQISETLSRGVIFKLLEKGVLPVVTGFIGETLDGRITTLGRGGSDYTASLLGRFLKARRVFIYTDVDGVFTKDPKVHDDAKLITEMTREEADAKAKAGEKVLYTKTVEPLIGTDIELYVKNTFNPSSIGTRIVDRKSDLI